MKFTKLHALGNDFVLTEDPEVAHHIVFIANRKYGIGCDQVILLNGRQVTFWNADGSRCKFCGNGCRAIFKYLGQNGSIETDSGRVEGELLEGRVRIVYPQGRIVSIENGIYLVNVGNLHKIHFREINLELENFDPGVNYMYLTWRDGWHMSIYEAGVGETEACGSGAMAASLAIWDHYGYEPLAINMRGGTLQMTRSEGRLTQMGEATLVYQGEIRLVKISIGHLCRPRRC